MSRLEILMENFPHTLDRLRDSTLWQITVLALIVFGLAALCGKLRKTPGRAVLFAALLESALVCSGILLIGNGFRDNAYSVSDTVIAVDVYVQKNCPAGQVYLPPDLTDEMKQYSARTTVFSDSEIDEETVRNAAERAGREMGENTLLENWLAGADGVSRVTGFLYEHPDICAVVLQTEEQTETGMRNCRWKADTVIGQYTIYVPDHDV